MIYEGGKILNNSFTPLYFTVLLITFSLTALIEFYLIPYLRGRANQPIYEDGPKWHALKGKTPTMGGIAFLISSTVAFLFSIIFFVAIEHKAYAMALATYAFLCIGNSLIGLIDDLTKLRRKKNAGLSPKQKIIAQAIIAVIFLFLQSKLLHPTLSFDLLIAKVSSPYFYYPVSLFLILGIVNCANLTDGIDGLASSVAYAIGASYFITSLGTGPVCTVISALLIGSSLAFLLFNINPAKIFMGDTGSLLLGALAVSCAFSSESPLSVIPIGVIYVIEGVSVIMQVFFFKLTKRRIFKMAPLHHHLEKSGMSENKICIIAIIITLLSSVLTFLVK